MAAKFPADTASVDSLIQLLVAGGDDPNENPFGPNRLDDAALSVVLGSAAERAARRAADLMWEKT